MFVRNLSSPRFHVKSFISVVFWILVLALMGCGGADSLTKTRQYTARTPNYAVTVSETTKQGHCHRRRITLRSRSGLHRVPVVSKIVAVDTDCDMEIDRFRPLTRAEDKDTWMANGPYIRRDVVKAYYKTVVYETASR